MTEQTTDAKPALAPTPTPTPTKAAIVLKLLARKGGATLAELITATAWQPHTVRAHLTRLRRAGRTLERVARKSGPDAYRAVIAVAPAAERQA